MIFNAIPIYVKIYVNKVEVTNLKSGQSVSSLSIQAFSTQRVVIADFNVLELCIRSLLNRELGIRTGFLPSRLKILIQQLIEVEGGLTEVEKRALRDLGE
ncbi:MAG: hypothetical protein V4722_14015 [Bacteroidota bacterium]